MSTRLKVFLIITGIILVITMSSMVISISSAQGQILKTLETELEKNVSVANEYILGEMELLKADAAAVAEMLKGYPIHQLRELLTEQIYAYENFVAGAIYNQSGNALASFSMGAAPAPSSVVLGEYGQIAFEGERVISTSFLDSSGGLVFYVFVPMDDYKQIRARGETPYNPSIVGLTVSGKYFSERVNRFKGRITIVDKRGKIIADTLDEWVLGQYNFLELKEKEPRYDDAARVIDRMLSATDSRGTDRYKIRSGGDPEPDVDNVTAFMPIASPEHWAVAVSASVADSSYYAIRGMIAISGFIFLGLGMLAAALASGVIAKPFELLKAAEKAKTAFIANMSHDLRTPLNAIIGFSQLSRTKKLPPEVGEHQYRIFESGMTILGVVNDLLDISNIESGKFGVISAEYDLPNFINDTARSNMRHLEAKPVVFNIIPEEKLPARLNGDSLRVRQVFNNVLSNAINHTKAGTVEWRISTEREGDTVWLVSSVSDSGGGISPEDIDKLFLDYSSLDTQKMRTSRGGTGLGLALTKKIVDLMKGTITVESTVGKGSVFTVRLPHKFVSDEVISGELAEKLKNFKSAGFKKSESSEMQRIQIPDARVLVVDDVEINLEVTKGMIEPYGIKVDCVLSAQEAVDLVRKGEPRYNAIFMNRWMPGMDGIEAVQIIRKEIGGEYAANIPIIALVANAIGNNTFFLNAGFQAVISKPINLFRLDDIIRQCVVSKK